MQYTYRLFTTLLIGGLLTVGVIGCDSFTSGEGLEKDPALATDTSPDLLLNGALVASILFQDGNHARMASIFNGQLTGADRQYAGFNSYGANSSDFDNMWITGYSDVIGDLVVAKKKAEGSNDYIVGISQVMLAYTFGTKAALHGSVPYKEAAQGGDNLNPAFADQMTVYNGVISRLDKAISTLQDAQAGNDVQPRSADIYFNGDAGKWLEVAYTLKARFLLHMDQPADALTAANNGISSSANNLMAPHGQTRGVNSNPFWLFHDIERTGYLQAGDSYAATILDPALDTTAAHRGNTKTDESGRFGYYFVGSPGAWDLNTADGAYFGQRSDYPLVTYRENELIKAEAHLQKSSPDQSAAVTALNNAREAFDAKFPAVDYYQDYTLSDFQSGNLANPQGESRDNALLREVLEEKYVSLMAHIEAFNDVRRTDNFLGIPPKAGSSIPQRFLVAQTEINANDKTPEPLPGLFDVTPANEFDYTGF